MEETIPGPDPTVQPEQPKKSRKVMVNVLVSPEVRNRLKQIKKEKKIKDLNTVISIMLNI